MRHELSWRSDRGDHRDVSFQQNIREILPRRIGPDNQCSSYWALTRAYRKLPQQGASRVQSVYRTACRAEKRSSPLPFHASRSDSGRIRAVCDFELRHQKKSIPRKDWDKFPDLVWHISLLCRICSHARCVTRVSCFRTHHGADIINSHDSRRNHPLSLFSFFLPGRDVPIPLCAITAFPTSSSSCLLS